MSKLSGPLRYSDAGVDIGRGERLVEAIKPLMRRTMDKHCLNVQGGFAGLYALPERLMPDGPEPSVLAAGADGVGTKLKLACELGRHDGIGIDLVAMCVNDILVHGARPLFFLDYYASGRLDEQTFLAVVRSICRGCEEAGCALLGGESAEMPGMYNNDEYDLAGFAVGIVGRDSIVDGTNIGPGDTLIGIASSGPHANGYSLIRAILERGGLSLDQPCGGATIGEALLQPTRIYVRSVLPLMGSENAYGFRRVIKGAAHITGGGIPGNLARILPPGIGARLEAASWPRPGIFDLLAAAGKVEPHDLYRTFNCGLGMVLATKPDDTGLILEHLQSCGENVFIIGETVAIKHGEDVVVIG